MIFSENSSRSRRGSRSVNPTVLYCCNAYPPNFIGGAELIAHRHAIGLKRLGHPVAVFAGDSSGAKPRHSVVKTVLDGLDVCRVHLTAADFDSRLVNFVNPAVEQRFLSVLEGVRPDIVHLHNLIGLSAGLIRLSKKFSAATILTVHDHWGFCYRNTLILDDGRICDDFRNCAGCLPSIGDGRGGTFPIRLRNDYLLHEFESLDLLVSPSTYLAHAYVRAGVPASKVRVIGNGFDTDRFLQIRRSPGTGKLRLTFLGHLGRHKGVHVLLEALTFLRESSAVELHIAGTGELEEQLKRDAEDRGIASAVNFLGKLDHRSIESLLSRTDALVLPSVWPENQPVSITEAMSAGIAVIASRIGGIPEMVSDGVSGYLFEPGNARDLALKIQKLMDAPGDLQRFGEAGRSSIGARSVEKQVERLQALYSEILAIPRSS